MVVGVGVGVGVDDGLYVLVLRFPNKETNLLKMSS